MMEAGGFFYIIFKTTSFHHPSSNQNFHNEKTILHIHHQPFPGAGKLDFETMSGLRFRQSSFGEAIVGQHSKK